MIGRGWTIWTFLALVLCAVQAQAATYWNDTFENHLTPSWDVSACTGATQDGGCNTTISTDTFPGWPVSGTRSLKSTYVGGGVQAGTYMDRAHTSTADVWMRWYFYFVNFVNDTNETKFLFNKTPSGGSYFIWAAINGARQVDSETQLPTPLPCPSKGGAPDSACNIFWNMGTLASLQNNTVYCIETHGNNGTPGQSNGVAEVFVNGAQVMGHYNLSMLASTTSPSLGLFNLVTHYTQYGQGVRYIDDLAVGNTRIGCGASPTSDITSPATVGGFFGK